MPGPPAEDQERHELTRSGLEPASARRAERRAEALAAAGYANYFDDRLLAGYDPSWGFLAEKLLLEHFNGAIKIHLTAPRPSDAPDVLERKKLFDAHWKDWKSCQRIAATKPEKTAFHLLEKKPDAMLALLREIPRAELAAHVAAYQAYLWNETLRRVLRETAGPAFTAYPGKAGDYLFADGLDPERARALEGLRIPLASEKARVTDERVRRHYEAVLTERGIDDRRIGRVKVKQAVFDRGSRPAWIRPGALSVERAPDPAAAGLETLALRCALPRASDASMLLKALLAEPAA